MIRFGAEQSSTKSQRINEVTNMSAPHIIPGPLTAKTSRAEAMKGLTSNPNFPKGAEFALTEINGQWVAAIHTGGAMPFAPEEEAAGGPPKPKDGPPSGEDDDGPPAPDDSDGPPTDDGGPDDGSDGPPKDDKGDKGKKGLDGKIDHLIELMTQITTALGISSPPGDSMVPGEEDAPPPPGDGGGPDGPPAPPHEHAPAEKPMKPGETPPGGTPVGAPAFASVRDDHPWKKYMGRVASFHIDNEPIGNTPLAEVHQELTALAHEGGYAVKRLQEGRDSEGRRTASVVVSAY